MKISKKTEYGLRAMVHLARNLPAGRHGKNKKAISIREISNTEGMPFEFLSKIFADLERASLVKAKHGANGGYFLAKPAKKITTADIAAVLEDDLAVVHCTGCPMAGGCRSQNVWEEVKQSINKTMGKTTLADLIK